MKGVILAGGKGTRLGRHTLVTNKHLVAVGKYPMIEYPLATLRRMGVNDITVVTGAEHAGAIVNYLIHAHPGVDFTFKVQKEAGGIAQALALVENVAKGDCIAVILGDNVFDADFSGDVKDFKDGALLFVKEVLDAQRFGVAEVQGSRIVSIEEKPKMPKSNLAVTGLYVFDSSVFDKIKTLKPSARGEFEITDVNNLYIKDGNASYRVVRGFWSDAGTHQSRNHAEKFVEESGYDPLQF